MTVAAEPTTEFDIAKVAEAWVLCRTLGHAWRAVSIDARDNSATFEIQCTRCKTRRSDRLDGRGGVSGRRYDYPEGYTHKGIKVERFEYRYELVVRARRDAGGS